MSKDENKRPMFPRLHINDTDKGGPRAPPRNKMALYEQLTIPSHSFVRPSNSLPSGSSTQGSGNERSSEFPSYVQLADKHQPDGVKSRTSSAKPRPRDEDEFDVPVFIARHGGGTQNTTLIHKPAPVNPTYFGGPVRIENVHQKDQEHDNFISGQERDRDEEIQRDEPEAEMEHKACGPKNVVESGKDINKGIVPGNFLGSHRHGAQQVINVDSEDDDSDTSMVDSPSSFDISPDDVVGIIGHKHFLKARIAISKQQRVFAVQVFELHRLIKVQQLIAGSPHLLLEESAYLGHPSIKSPRAERLPTVKKLPKIDDMEKFKNAIERTSHSCGQEGSQVSNKVPYDLGKPPLDSRMGPWSYSQSPGQQWLIPVMSPSEGLIYKPYAGPGFMGMGPMNGNFMGPTCGFPAPNQGAVFNPAGHGYFPPYGMQVMNHIQMNQFIGTAGAHSCASIPFEPPSVFKDIQAQGNRDSAPEERVQEDEPTVATRPIKVVPRNAKLATESAARIFQSIQEERQHHDFA